MSETREFTIVALDPGVRRRGEVLTARVSIPKEALAPGPRGHRVHVVDYDATTHTLYAASAKPESDLQPGNHPAFHAQNVYAIVMRTLARFEHALGRRVSWGFGGHQIKIAPHAFCGANAYYSREHEALLFGYYKGRDGYEHTCLSHDIVAHETAHALLDGIRERYTDPSLPDQAAFHEGFADLVAMLSMFSLPEVVQLALPARRLAGKWPFRESMLLAIGRRLGELRRSVAIRPDRSLLAQSEFQDAHRRGEILVAAVLNAFVEAWQHRASADRKQAIAQGAEIADHLLTSVIRALDYAPPVDISFSDYLGAILTAEAQSSSSGADRFGIQAALRRSFAGFGISAPARKKPPAKLVYRQMHLESLQRDSNEIFRFLWENRRELQVHEEAYTQVLSVRPCTRIGADGFVLRETVAEYIQALRLRAGELNELRLEGMSKDQVVVLYGGGTLVFDEYGGLKHHIAKPITDRRRQAARLNHLWKTGQLDGRKQNNKEGAGERPHPHVRGRSWRLLSPKISLPRAS